MPTTPSPEELHVLLDRRQQLLAEIAEYHRFKAATGELVEVSTRICDARLQMKQTSSDTAVRF